MSMERIQQTGSESDSERTHNGGGVVCGVHHTSGEDAETTPHSWLPDPWSRTSRACDLPGLSPSYRLLTYGAKLPTLSYLLTELKRKRLHSVPRPWSSNSLGLEGRRG
jgi:hypothetical protein